MEPKKCPQHNNFGIVPTDENCHNHIGDIRQWLHNKHCKALRCPHAQSGHERNEDVPTLPARSKLGQLIEWLDSKTLWRKKIEKILKK